MYFCKLKKKEGSLGKFESLCTLTLTLNLSHWYHIIKNSNSLCQDPYFWIQNFWKLFFMKFSLNWPMKSSWGRGNSWRTAVRLKSTMRKETSEDRGGCWNWTQVQTTQSNRVWKTVWEVKSQARWGCQFNLWCQLWPNHYLIFQKISHHFCRQGWCNL